MPDYFLTQDIADALCTVITLGYAKKKEKAGKPVTFEYSFYNKENPPDVNKDAIAEERDYQLLQDVLGHRGLNIQVRMSAPQDGMPYILGSDLPLNSLNTFIPGFIPWANRINDMFIEANGQNPPPRGAYIGVQFFAAANGTKLEGIQNLPGGNFDAEPVIWGPSALSLRTPVYRRIDTRTRDGFNEQQAIAVAYYNARKSTNDAARAVANGLHRQPHPDFDTDYIKGHIFGSCHGMIRAMVNRVIPPQGIHSVFAEIALGNNTTRVSSCIPCAMFMESFGKPASSIHLGRGDNWWIADNPPEVEVLTNWRNYIIGYYMSGLEVINPRIATHNNTLDNLVAMIIAQRHAVGDILPYIPDLFLEALTFENSFIKRILRTLFP